MNCYSCRKYDTCPLGWKCSADLYGCSAYEVEQTNEEWFCDLSTEEKAKIIKTMINTCTSCKEHGTLKKRGCILRQKMAKGLLFLPCMDEDGICEWLKQPYTR